jgi:hypothetical protein
MDFSVKGSVMNEDEIKGVARDAAGKVKTGLAV